MTANESAETRYTALFQDRPGWVVDVTDLNIDDLDRVAVKARWMQQLTVTCIFDRHTDGVQCLIEDVVDEEFSASSALRQSLFDDTLIPLLQLVESGAVSYKKRKVAVGSRATLEFLGDPPAGFTARYQSRTLS